MSIDKSNFIQALLNANGIDVEIVNVVNAVSVIMRIGKLHRSEHNLNLLETTGFTSGFSYFMLDAQKIRDIEKCGDDFYVRFLNSNSEMRFRLHSI